MSKEPFCVHRTDWELGAARSHPDMETWVHLLDYGVANKASKIAAILDCKFQIVHQSVIASIFCSIASFDHVSGHEARLEQVLNNRDQCHGHESS